MFKNYKPSKYTSYLLFVLPIIFFFFIDMSRETDIWFLFSHGREVLMNGFPHTEFLTIHTGLHFVMQQWLSSVIFYFIYNNFGFVGLYILMFIINGLIILFTYKLCLVITNKKIYASVFITIITDLLLELMFIIPRPQTISILLLVIELYILETFINNKSNKIIYLLPLLSILLINFHSSIWPILFIFMGPYLVELLYLLIKEKDKRFYILSIILIVSIIFGIINPYGIEGMTYFMSSYGVKEINQFIEEMHHIGFIGKGTKYLSIFLIVYILFYITIIIKNKNKISIRQLILFVGTSFMACINLRSTSLLFISTIPHLSKYIPIKDGKNKYVPIKSYIVCMVIIIISISFSINNKNYIIKSNAKPVLNYLNNNTNKNIKLYTNFDDGPYFEYNGYKVYIDSRAEVFLKSNNHKEDIFIEYTDIISGKSNIKDFLNKYNFDYLLVNNTDRLYEYLNKDKNYIMIYNYKYYYLFKRL